MDLSNLLGNINIASIMKEMLLVGTVGAPRGPLHAGRSTKAALRESLHEGCSTGGLQIFLKF